MRVFIQVVQDSLKTQTVEALSDIPLVVGRLEECGLVIPSDPYISRRHCIIHLLPPDCYLNNTSDSGTFLNGETIVESPLKHGDEIRLSEHTLLLVVFGENSESDHSLNVIGLPTYTTKECNSGLTLFTSRHPQPGPMETAQKLAQHRSLSAMIDFHKLNIPVPDDLENRDALFYWHAEEVSAKISPLVIASDQTQHFFECLEQGWGQDGIVCLFSQLSRENLLQHLRTITCPDPNKGMLGIYWPNVLAAMLESQQAKFVSKFFDGIEAVMVETDQSPSGWSLYAPQSFSEILQEAGLTHDSGEAPETLTE